jgi:GR25 family glycosyltransferase involved in LPS biosynthesis
MNLLQAEELQAKLAHVARVVIRHLDPFRRADAFSSKPGSSSISRIYVINLDRKPNRWTNTRKELDRFRTDDSDSLTSITRRFSAVDARYLSAQPNKNELIPAFSLAEQLAVHPDPLLKIDDASRALVISMTKPEIAIAMSHIEVWKLIAAGDAEWTMVLEDDVIMRPGFATKMNRQWPALVETNAELVYLAYRDVSGIERTSPKAVHHQVEPGLWEASAYVLSREGARRLLSALPANGPIDLWMNFRFSDVRTFTTATQVIEQRLAEPSTNSYSVLPVLSRVGSVTREKVLVPRATRLSSPVVVIGPENSGLSSLAIALSTIGYSVASDLSTLPPKELDHLIKRRKGSAFNAFVNVGDFDNALLKDVMARRTARLIVTDGRDRPEGVPSSRTLRLLPSTTDKWESLSAFLDLEYPTHPFPTDTDEGQRPLEDAPVTSKAAKSSDLKWDRSPWIVPTSALPGGIRIASSVPSLTAMSWYPGERLSEDEWLLRDDTFPSNLAIFQPKNVMTNDSIDLSLRREKSLVRDFSAAAIAARQPFQYGTFGASLRPARGSGVITGLFLHRSTPRQEIDIEFRGKDTTKMLVNVFYNPGAEGTKLEYGYRGTPSEIDLGFDAADSFHFYEIEWRADAIVWKVDGEIVYERSQWNPTPVPDRPMEFNINIWTSRSIEFAGELDANNLPATTSIRKISVHT